MHNLTAVDLDAINNLVIAAIALGLFLSFILFSLFRQFFIFLARKFSIPLKIRTEHGYLYRAQTGVYASRERVLEIDTDLKLKRKERAIKYHEYVLYRLKNSDWFMLIFLLVSFIITGVFWLYCVYWDFKTAGGRIND